MRASELDDALMVSSAPHQASERAQDDGGRDSRGEQKEWAGLRGQSDGLEGGTARSDLDVPDATRLYPTPAVSHN